MLALLEEVPEGGWYRANQNQFADAWAPDDLRPLINVDSNPPPSRIIEAWSGFGWDCRRSDLILFGGGHASYSGNEVYRWRTRSGLWERLSLPSEIAPDGGTGFSAIDGPFAAPSSAHTYDTNIYLPIADRFLVFGGAAYSHGGAFRVRQLDGTYRPTGPYTFDVARGDPDKVGGTTGSHVQRVAPYPEVTGGMFWVNRDIYEFVSPFDPGNFVNGTSAYTALNGKDVVLVTGFFGSSTSAYLYRYVVTDVDDPRSDTFERIGDYWHGFGSPSAGAYDPDRNIYLMTWASGTAKTFTYFNVGTAGPNNLDVNFQPTDLSGGFVATDKFGVEYDPIRHEFLLWEGGGGVWRLRPPPVASPFGWTLERAIAPSTAVPGIPFNGVHGKWKYVDELDAFVGLENSVEGNVWFYKPVGWQRPGTSNPAPTVALSADPTSVLSGQPSILNWSSTNATSCTAGGAWSGPRNTSGSESTGPLVADASYTLTCSGDGGSSADTLTVSVSAPPVPAPTLTFAASPTTIAAGQASTLSWSATGATSCIASDGWSGTRNTAGSASSGPLTATTTFTLACSGPGGSVSQAALVTVAPAPTVALSADPASVLSGQPSTLSWSSTNATSCTASGAWSGPRNTSGSESTGPLTQTTRYMLECFGPTGDAASTDVTVSLSAPHPDGDNGTNGNGRSGGGATGAWLLGLAMIASIRRKVKATLAKSPYGLSDTARNCCDSK